MTRSDQVERLERAMLRLGEATARLVSVGPGHKCERAWVNGWHEAALRLSLRCYAERRPGCNYADYYDYGVTRT